MIRTLAIIALAGTVVSAATLSAAFFIAGPENVLDHGAWTFGSHGWGHHGWHEGQGAGPQTSRDIAWTGGDSLSVDVDADVAYTQAPGPAKVTVSGPQGAVADVEIADGSIRYVHDRDHDARLTITVSAPAVTHFTMESSGKLDIAAYHQDSLTLDLEGDADVKAAGEAKALKLTISGSGDADLSALKLAAAEVDVEGSGSAKLAPTAEARVDVEGSGDVRLLTNPPKLATHIDGSGQITHGAETTTGD